MSSRRFTGQDWPRELWPLARELEASAVAHFRGVRDFMSRQQRCERELWRGLLPLRQNHVRRVCQALLRDQRAEARHAWRECRALDRAALPPRWRDALESRTPWPELAAPRRARLPRPARQLALRGLEKP